MELAKVSSKGQITIPNEIRKRLGVKEGDKILFFEDRGRIVIENSSLEAWKAAQRSFVGEAKQAGLKDEDDVVAMVADIRRERMNK